MMVFLVLVELSVLLIPALSSPPLPPPPPLCNQYGVCPPYHPQHHHHFVPAPPGKTPNCAKHGSTFCEKIDQYPTSLIRYLVEHWSYDYMTLLSDESKNEFPKKSKPITPTYGPPQVVYSHPYSVVRNPFYPSPLAGNFINYSQPQGYPDRRYPLATSQPYFNGDPGLIYSSLLQPSVTPYDPSHWWKRVTRSDESSRTKRQLPGQDTQLCPTRSQFVSPRAALNAEGNWMYVVNLEQDQNRFTQQVRAESCAADQCAGLCTLPNGYTSRCQQQYVQKRLIALKGSGSELYTDTFWLPHCCICQITRTN